MRLAVLVIGLFACISCTERTTGNQDNIRIPDDTTGQAAISFEAGSHDYGTLIEGELVSYTFRFTNSGTAPLIVTSASASCGCTVPSYSKEPTPPGGQGKIVVEFDSRGRLGSNHKTIAIRSNSNPPVIILNIYAEVVRKDI